MRTFKKIETNLIMSNKNTVGIKNKKKSNELFNNSLLYKLKLKSKQNNRQELNFYIETKRLYFCTQSRNYRHCVFTLHNPIDIIMTLVRPTQISFFYRNK